MRRTVLIGVVPWLLILFAFAWGQDATLYVTTLSTSYTHTGQKHSLSGLFFKSVGPDTNWQITGRPNNRAFKMDAFDPADGQILAIATHTGVHQSWDGGKSWKVTTDWKMTEVSNVVFDPTTPDILYAGSPYGFYKTLDGGKTWKQYNTGLNSVDATFVSDICLDPTDRSHLFISTEDGIYESFDFGETWTRSGLLVRNIRTVVMHPENPDILIAGTENHGIYMSLNAGKHWEKRDTGVLHETFYGFAFDPSHPDTLYAGGFQTGVYKSINGGKTWKQHFKGLGLLDIHAIAVDPTNSNRIYAGTMGKGVYMSKDGGLEWRFIGIDNGFIWGLKIESYEEPTE